MRWALVLACACGRIGFGSVPAPPDAPDVGYFVAPGGNDGNAGTRHAPWGTLAYAVSRLQPGDTLNLLDGDYDARGTTGVLHIDCTSGAQSGTQAAPIVVRADRPRGAHLTGGATALWIEQCAFWEFDGLWLDGTDDMTATGSVADVYDDTDLVFRGLLVQHPNRYVNSFGIDIGRTQRVTVEDAEIYDFHRAGLSLYLSTQTTVDRLYANGRGDPDIAGGIASICPGGDVGVQAYESRGGNFAHMIAEDVCDAGLEIVSGVSAGASDTGVGDGHTFTEAITLGPASYGFSISTDCTMTMPCTSPDQIASNNTISQAVAIDTFDGFELMGTNNQLTNATAINPTSNGLLMDSADGVTANASASGFLDVGGMIGIYALNQASWSVTGSNIFGATTPWQPNQNVTATQIDPQLGSCLVYLPPGSPMIGAGPNGTSIGADIQDMWHSDGTFIGCGAIVPGVNDDPARSCSGVHQRLHVHSSGCP